ncbi:MAG TPA: LptF/LptG family permease [Elusimicrobiota bacterium]|nr:LptF/LptG family permease [Elusimicrobiota bacterium]
MNRITKYFLEEFLQPLFVSYGALVILVLVAELMEQMDKFISGKAGVWMVMQYLLSLLPMRSMEVLPVAVLLATLFSLGNLSRRQEITAAMSGGIHPWRCVKLLLATGALLSVLTLALSEWVVPFANRHAKKIWKMDIRHLGSFRQTRFDNLTMAGQGGVFYSIGTLDVEKGILEDLVVEWFENGRPRRQIQAEKAEWRPGEGWVFNNGVERIFSDDAFALATQTPFSEKTVALEASPEDLIPKEPEAEEMNYKQYNRHIRRLRRLGVSTRRQEVELHMKLAFPLTSFIVLLLGIPFGFQKTGGKVKAIGMALAVAFFYFGLMEVGRAVGQKSWCPTILAAWLANLVFLGVGGWLFVRMRKLS